MAYLSKDAYWGKQQYANKLRKEDAEHQETLRELGEKALTEEQIDVLEEICTRRHNLHSTDARRMMNDSNDDLDFFTDDCSDKYVNCKLHEVGLEPIENLGKYSSDKLWSELEVDEELEERSDELGLDDDSDDYYDLRYEIWDDICCRLSNQLNELNDLIENYLRKIDAEFGTHYCPTGCARSADLL